MHLWHGRLSGVPYPIIPGHVSAGIARLGARTLERLDGSVLREGDRVVFFDVHRTCGHCRACTVHRTPTRCPSRRVYGITDPPRKGCSAAGRSTSTSSPASASRGCQTTLAFDDYIGGGCGLLTAVHVMERASMKAGDTVVVQGTGAVGLSTIALARLAGAAAVFAIGAPRAASRARARDGRRPDVLDLAAHVRARARSTRSARGPTAKAPTSSSKPPDRRAPSKRASRWSATAAATSSPGTTPTSARARSTRTTTSTASTSRFAGAGAARRGTSSARSSCSSGTRRPCRGERSARAPIRSAD